MGNIVGGNRNNNGNQNYRFSNANGLYFGDHFVMGGEEFEALDPEAFLFGEMGDLDYLSRMPGTMNRPPTNIKHTNATRCLLFTNKETLKLVPHASNEPNNENVENGAMHIDFMFDADAACKVTVHFFAQEEIDGDGGIHFKSKFSWPSFHYAQGYGQEFSQPQVTINNLDQYAEKDLFYQTGSTTYPVVVHIVAETESSSQHSLATYAQFEKSNSGVYSLKPLIQKANINGLNFVLKEIFGIEKKEENRDADESSNFGDFDDDNDNTECVVCMSSAKDTMALPCRHLCLCNPCADVLRFQANKCPICRAPFHSLLQIRVLKPEDEVAKDNESDEEENEHVPPGFATISIAEAVSGSKKENEDEILEGYMDVESVNTTPVVTPRPSIVGPDTDPSCVAVGPNDQPPKIVSDLFKRSFKTTKGNEDSLSGAKQKLPDTSTPSSTTTSTTTPTATTTTTTTVEAIAPSTDSTRTDGGNLSSSSPNTTTNTTTATATPTTPTANPTLRSGDLSKVNFHNYPSDERLEMGGQVVWSSKEGAESDRILPSPDTHSFNLPGTPDTTRQNSNDKSFNTLEI